MPMLILMCGLPGAGKTTLARRLAMEIPALRFTPDEWIGPLYGTDLTQQELDDCRYPCEDRMWAVAEAALRNGLNAILDFGFWSRQERDDYKARAAALGATTKVCYLAATRDELRQRIDQCNAEMPSGELYVSPDLLDGWLKQFEPPEADEQIFADD